MLLSLSIGDVVLIDSVDIAFGGGLCVLTGETGAGKSILLDSLGLALGMRASASLVRGGPGDEQRETPARATIAASFDIEGNDAVPALLAEQALMPPEPGEPLLLRRSVDANGRSRAFVNDQPVGVQLLRQIGDLLVEIEGQFASQGLMDERTHRNALDDFAGLAGARRDVGVLWQTWRDAEAALAAARSEIRAAREEEDYLRHAAAELADLNPRSGEEQTLADSRTLLMHGEKLVEALASADKALTDRNGIDDRLAAAIRILTRQATDAGERLDPILASLEAASDSVADALTGLNSLMADSQPDPARLERCEERLFALRAAARKYNVTVEDLPRLREEMENRIAALEDTGAALNRLETACIEARSEYVRSATALSDARAGQAKRLDKAVSAELPALRLEKARFATLVDRQDEDGWGPSGFDRVRFEVAANPGLPPAPLSKAASGGELARFLLALKVVLQEAHGVATLVFDEVDSGLGGAAAAAVGERLASLAKSAQVLVVTHSPQVAACGAQHLRVAKGSAAEFGRKGVAGDDTITVVEELSPDARREEIARMLAGARITDEARAAADRLIAGNAL